MRACNDYVWPKNRREYHEEQVNFIVCQPPPQALRSFRILVKGERETRVTGDEARVTTGRRKN